MQLIVGYWGRYLTTEVSKVPSHLYNNNRKMLILDGFKEGIVNVKNSNSYLLIGVLQCFKVWLQVRQQFRRKSLLTFDRLRMERELLLTFLMIKKEIKL